MDNESIEIIVIKYFYGRKKIIIHQHNIDKITSYSLQKQKLKLPYLPETLAKLTHQLFFFNFTIPQTHNLKYRADTASRFYHNADVFTTTSTTHSESLSFSRSPSPLYSRRQTKNTGAAPTSHLVYPLDCRHLE